MRQAGVAPRAGAERVAAAAVRGAGAPLAGAPRLGAAAPGGCSRCSSQPSSQACPPWLPACAGSRHLAGFTEQGCCCTYILTAATAVASKPALRGSRAPSTIISHLCLPNCSQRLERVQAEGQHRLAEGERADRGSAAAVSSADGRQAAHACHAASPGCAILTLVNHLDTD